MTVGREQAPNEVNVNTINKLREILVGGFITGSPFQVRGPSSEPDINRSICEIRVRFFAQWLATAVNNGLHRDMDDDEGYTHQKESMFQDNHCPECDLATDHIHTPAKDAL